MLKQLSIKNFGLIEELELEFNSNLSIFTGETGAGKSIIFDALRYVLGERLMSSQIKDKNKACFVEAIIHISNKFISEVPEIKDFLTDHENELIISRITSTDGKNKIKINGFSLTVSALKEIGNNLIDFHGPHDHQMLFSEETHIKILDRLSNISQIKDNYSLLFEKFQHLNKKLRTLQESASSRERDLDFLKHQITELEQISLETTEYEKILANFDKIENTEKLYELASGLLNIFENNENGITDLLTSGFKLTNSLEQLDATTKNLGLELSAIQEESNSLLSNLENYLETLSFEDEHAQEIKDKYEKYNLLIRKYGPTIENVQQYYNDSLSRYNTLIDFEHNDNKLKSEIEEVKSNLIIIAKKITKIRIKTAQSLNKTIEHELKELGIKHIRFDCRISETSLNENGQDNVTFYISPNAGEDLKPLAEIVSSGEAARLMLALKKALTNVDPIPILIFDEIDAQIGGRLGTITGKKIKELAEKRQVLLITHLPQIAAFAQEHYLVLKNVKNNRTSISIETLKGTIQIEELSRMMGDAEGKETSKKHAREMLEAAANSSKANGPIQSLKCT